MAAPKMPRPLIQRLRIGGLIGFLLASSWPALAQSSPKRPLPRVLYLRMMIVPSQDSAAQAHARLEAGEPFHKIAREHSRDASAANGGYLGRMEVKRMNAEFSREAMKLSAGSFGRPFRLGGGWALLYRMPRDFRDRGYRLTNEADQALAEGKVDKALELYRGALNEFPDFIHGWFKLGVAFGKAGHPDLEAESYQRALSIEPLYHQAHYNLGALHLSQGNFAAAIRSFRKALDINPDLVQCWVNISGAYAGMGQRQEAVEAAQQAIRINPLHPVAHFNLGVAHGEAAPEKAFHAFEKALTLEPGRADFVFSSAVALAHMGRGEDAKDRLTDLLRRHPEMERAKAALAELETALKNAPATASAPSGTPSPQKAPNPAPVRSEPVKRPTDEAGELAAEAEKALRRGDFPTALRQFEEAVSLQPTSRDLQFKKATTLLLFGQAMQRMGRWEEAVRLWTRALDGYPDFVPAMGALARAAIVQGRFTAGDKYLARARQIAPRDPSLIILTSRLHYERRELEKAFQALAPLKPAALEGPVQVALMEQLLFLDLNQEAAELFDALRIPPAGMLEAVNHLIRFRQFEKAEEYLKSHPTPYGQALLGKLLSEQLRFDEALRTLEQVAQTDPSAWSAQFFLGQVHNNAGQADKAAESFRKAMQLQPRNVNVMLELGKSLAQAGQSQEALEWLSRGLELTPGNAQLNFEKGKILLETGKSAQAEAFLKKTLEAEPDHIRTHYLLGRLYREAGRIQDSRTYLDRFKDLKTRLDEGRQKLLAQQKALKGRRPF